MQGYEKTFSGHPSIGIDMKSPDILTISKVAIKILVNWKNDFHSILQCKETIIKNFLPIFFEQLRFLILLLRL